MGLLESSLAFADAWGGMADVIGVVIALVGFSATVWSAWRAKTASEQARSMVEKLREESRRMDFVAECATAIGMMNQIKTFHREPVALAALLSYYPLLRSKLIVVKSYPGLSESQKIEIQRFLPSLSRMEAAVEQCLPSGIATIDVAKYNKSIQDQADLLQDVMTVIKTSVTE